MGKGYRTVMRKLGDEMSHVWWWGCGCFETRCSRVSEVDAARLARLHVSKQSDRRLSAIVSMQQHQILDPSSL
jgi:hypothetical protein